MFRLFVSCFDGERNLEDCSQLFSAKENLKMATIRKEGSWRRWKRVTLKPGRDGELGKCKRFKFISVHQDLSIRICGFHLGVSWFFLGVRTVLELNNAYYND